MKRNKKFKQLVTTATELFTKFGMKRVSVEEICQKSPVSKATFYKHFRNKNHLIEYILKHWFDEMYAALDIIDKKAIPFPQKIQEFFQIKKTLVKEMSPEFLKEYLHLTPELQESFNQLKHQSYHKFLIYVKKWQQEGHIRPDIKPDFIVAALGNLEYFNQNTSLVNAYPNFTDYMTELWNYFFYGILTQRPADEKDI